MSDWAKVAEAAAVDARKHLADHRVDVGDDRVANLMHVLPADAGHHASPQCWCLPWEDAQTRGLWIHREVAE